MRVICTLREIQEELGLSKSDLERELKMDSRTIDKLLVDSAGDPWRLDREMLHRYFHFAHSHGFDPFRFEPQAMWRTFQNSEVTIYRGPKKADVPVENLLVRYFERLHCEIHSSTSPEGLEEAMRERNCVVIGSPKANEASEIALSLLCGCKPFTPQAKNRERLPVLFFGMATDGDRPSVLLQESSRHGIGLRPANAIERKFLRVDWFPIEKFGPYQGEGQDAAVIVACNRPLGTERDVTTIVIAGYTGLATFVAAQEAAYMEIPDLQPDAQPGQPCFTAMKFQYKKRKQTRQSLDNLRKLVQGSVEWGPPWEDFFS